MAEVADRFLIVERHGYPDEKEIEAFADSAQGDGALSAAYTEEQQQALNVRLVREDRHGDWWLDF